MGHFGWLSWGSRCFYCGHCFPLLCPLPGPRAFIVGRRNTEGTGEHLFSLYPSAWPEVLWLEGRRQRATFHKRTADVLGKVWRPEVGRALRGTLCACAGNKQSSFRDWVTTDGTGLARRPFSQALQGTSLFAILRQLNRLEAFRHLE